MYILLKMEGRFTTSETYQCAHSMLYAKDEYSLHDLTVIRYMLERMIE